MTTIVKKRMTLEEFRKLPEGPPYYEFEEGEVILVSSPTLVHQEILAAIVEVLRPHVRKQGLGRVAMGVDVYLPDGRVYIPDLAFVSASRLSLLATTDKKIHGSPDLVVEITSSVPEDDRERKFRVYYDNGVPWYWIVDGETLAIEEYHAGAEGYVRTTVVASSEEFQPKLFPGLTIDLAELLDVSA